MAGQETSLVDRLCEAQDPSSLNDWEVQDGYYVASCRVSAQDVPGLIHIVRGWCEPDLLDDAHPSRRNHANFKMLPVTAWRALADLKTEAAAAVEPLIEILCELGDEIDDWALEELPPVLGKIGQPALEPLTHVMRDAGREQITRSTAVRGLRSIADNYPALRDSVVERLIESMVNADDEALDFNSTLLIELVQLRAVGAAESIERAFAANRIDVGMMGDWEEVRRELGVEGLGLAMPEDPHNSIEDFRTRMGIGIFSDVPIFDDGELDPDAADAYLERADEAFKQSSEAMQVVERHGELMRWYQMLLDFGLHYLGETVDEMARPSVEEFVLDHLPRKVSTDADSAASIVFELTMFWQYLDRAYNLPEAKGIVAWLTSGGLVGRLKSALSDPSNFGMAKSLFMQGKSAGYDMMSQEGMAEFITDYNQSLQADSEPDETPESRWVSKPIVRGERIGRNAPCPCGSGKKHKKCCGAPSNRN